MCLGLTTAEWLDLGVAVGTGLLALGTFALAWQTHKMVDATETMADAAQGQLAEQKRAGDIAERGLAASLRILRVRGNEAAVGFDEHDEWVVTLEKVGEAPVALTQPELWIGNRRTDLEAYPPSWLPGNGAQCAARGRVHRDDARALRSGQPAVLSITCKTPAGDESIEEATLHTEDGGTTWLISEDEKPAQRRYQPVVFT